MKAWLEGEEFDLQDLAALFPTGDTRVVHEGDGYFLTSPDLDNRSPAAPIQQVATTALTRINGIGRAINPDFRPVRLSGRYDDGQNAFVAVEASFGGRARLTVDAVVCNADGEEIPQPSPPGPVYVDMASDKDVSEVLTIMGQSGELSWGELYKIYEIIQDRVGSLSARGWGIAKNTEQAFTASANHQAISGSKARHARFKGSPPGESKRMSEEEARRFISGVVAHWLKELSDGHMPIPGST
ncbi:hypothetical protein [Nocardia sp. NPDC047654]|uniref:hypothetical protein n=1 Tax=Nocardia sp. NPDC047654 TaxID=3364314 RepID=UPI00371DAF3B